MKIDLLFLLPDEQPQKLMYVCPTCEGQNFLEVTTELELLRCASCGTTVDASEAELELLSNNTKPAEELHPTSHVIF